MPEESSAVQPSRPEIVCPVCRACFEDVSATDALHCSGCGRDYPVVLGILVIGSLLRLFGNIFSDILYAVIDPRIRFK